MRIKNDSLLMKIIFYNEIAIFLTSLLIGIVVIVTSFNDVERRAEDTAKNKMELLVSQYEANFSKVRNDVYRELGKSEIKEKYSKSAQKLKEELLKQDFKSYYDSVITILSEDGIILDEYGNENYLGTLSDGNIKILLENAKRRQVEEEGYYLVAVGDNIYSRIIIPYGNSLKYIVISIPINYELLQSLTGKLNLFSKDKIYFLTREGKNGSQKTQKFFSVKNYEEITEKGYLSYYLNKTIQGESYHLGVYNLISYDNKYLGSFVLAISKENLMLEKLTTTIYILVLVLLVMVMSSTLSSKFFRKLLLPLAEIAEVADRITSGENIKQIQIVGEGEIKSLSVSFKKMIEKLNLAQRTLKVQNEELSANLQKIEAIDKLLMNINLEKDTHTAIKKLISGFTSNYGLGYARAMYFRYSRENDYLVGEEVSTNDVFHSINQEGFKFQIKNLEELVLSTKIPIQNDNLMSKSFKEQRIIYKNDSGYKYELGNDLLKAIGLRNFFIFPINSAGKYSGVILVDNYTRDVRINQEELELLHLLSINFSIGINNKENTLNLLQRDRVQTIEKLATRFLKIRGEVVEKLLDCIHVDNSAEVIIERLTEIEGYLERIKKDNNSLRAYSEQKVIRFKEISLEKVVSDLIEEYKIIFEKANIFVSFFSTTDGTIKGDEAYMKRALKEILSNCYDTLMKKENNRRIDIILTKKRLNNKIELKIIDNGLGMAEKQLEEIYEPFVTYSPQNLGLGLFYAKKIIKDHNGVIKHFSEEGKNTEVRITLNAYKEEI